MGRFDYDNEATLAASEHPVVEIAREFARLSMQIDQLRSQRKKLDQEQKGVEGVYQEVRARLLSMIDAPERSL